MTDVRPPTGEVRTRRRWAPLFAVEGATLLSGTANGITSVVLPWLVLERTGSPVAAGVVAAATALPLLLSSLVAGTLVDRIGRRRASVVSDVLSALSVAAIPALDATVGITLVWIVVFAVLGAVFDPTGVTARESMLPEAAGVARVPLERINGLHEAVWGLSFVIGPGVGGVLIAVIGAENALWATAVAFVASALIMIGVRVPGSARPVRVPVADRTSFVHETLAGLRFVWRDKLLLTIAVFGTVLAGTYLPIEGVLLPIYFQREDTPEQLGLLLVTMSVGWIIGSLVYGAIGDRLPRRATFVVSSIGTAVALIPMAFLPSLPLLLVSGALTGLFYGPVNPLINLVLQVRSPPAMRGRVIGVVTSAGYAAGPLGYLVAGPLVEWLGLQGAFAVVIGSVVAAGAATLFMPSLRQLDDLQPPADAAPGDEPPDGDAAPPAGRSLTWPPSPVGTA